MKSTTRRLVAGTAIVIATLGGSVGTAAADMFGFIPCGCPIGSVNNGKAAATPAADNPTGTVGNADNDNRVYNVCQTCDHYPSAVVDFAP